MATHINTRQGMLPFTKSTPRPVAPRLKILIRRLPPGLTQEEFVAALGSEWIVGAGKVDWFLYKPGKDSKDPSKLSRPSRAYLRLKDESDISSLAEAVRQTTFEDAQNTFTNACSLGPPTTEFAPYGKTPGVKGRLDQRNGTIDQDPEFMAFLEGLANPSVSKELGTDISTDSTKAEKVTMTPLVQYLKDKKASKSKDAAARAAKKQELSAKSKVAKDASKSPDKRKDNKADSSVEKVAREAVKILNREATKAGSSSPAAEGSTNPKPDTAKSSGRQRGVVTSAHIRMLQRDLGLSPAQAHREASRQVRRGATEAQKTASASEKASADANSPLATSQQATTAPAAGSAATQSGRRARGKVPENEIKSTSSPSSASPNAASPAPMVLLKKSDVSQGASAAPSAQLQQQAKLTIAPARKAPVAVPSEGATQAFVKHANPSQGVTELLLKEAMENYGAVSMVEIDRRKGFAYVDFVEPDGLKKAMAANPISVAQGTVQVMQRKGTSLPPDKKPQNQAPNGPARGGGGRGGRGGTIGRRGGRGGGRGGSASAGSSEGTKALTSVSTGPAK